jgi:hypothetical protein
MRNLGVRSAGPLVRGQLARRCARLAAEPAADQQAGRLRSDWNSC